MIEGSKGNSPVKMTITKASGEKVEFLQFATIGCTGMLPQRQEDGNICYTGMEDFATEIIGNIALDSDSFAIVLYNIRELHRKLLENIGPEAIGILLQSMKIREGERENLYQQTEIYRRHIQDQ